MKKARYTSQVYALASTIALGSGKMVGFLVLFVLTMYLSAMILQAVGFG
jgi:hypothetical protein